MGEKLTKSKLSVKYQVIVRGEIPENIQEHLSAIHAQAILKPKNRTVSDSNKQTRISVSKAQVGRISHASLNTSTRHRKVAGDEHRE